MTEVQKATQSNSQYHSAIVYRIARVCMHTIQGWMKQGGSDRTRYNSLRKTRWVACCSATDCRVVSKWCRSHWPIRSISPRSLDLLACEPEPEPQFCNPTENAAIRIVTVKSTILVQVAPTSAKGLRMPRWNTSSCETCLTNRFGPLREVRKLGGTLLNQQPAAGGFVLDINY